MASQGGGSNLPFAGIAAVIVAAIGAVLWTAVPLEVPRPAPSAQIRAEEPTLQDVAARLWEDPLAAVAREVEAPRPTDGKGARHEIDGLCNQLQLGGTRGADGKPLPRRLLVLGVMVSNTPYADGEENRRRIRHAVQSALYVSHFTPDNAQHLGYFHWERKADPLIVPFELFSRKNARELKQDYRLLVLWLEDEWFTVSARGKPEPLARLAKLAHRLADGCLAPAGVKRDGGLVNFAVLGPAGSGTLRAMRQEAEPWTKPPAGLEHVTFYSAAATAAERDLLQRDADCTQALPDPRKGKDFCSLHAFFRSRGVSFYRTTATDDQLSRAIKHELELRGVWPGGPSGHFVAVVSEWDSYYGRMLPKAFMRVSQRERACETDPTEPNLSSPDTGAEEKGPCRILRFSYLRGLDGQVPPSDEAARAAAKDASKAATPRTRYERAEGVKQFDYLRRLAERIRDTDLGIAAAGESGALPSAEGSFVREECAREICAFGVLGSDVYDKLAVLRALRREFPRAVFFTTDLDARLLDDDEQEWTRNLIVASSFGLELQPCLQRNVPPFRGTYQTAAYLATQLAVFNSFLDYEAGRELICPAADGGSESKPSQAFLPTLSRGQQASAAGYCGDNATQLAAIADPQCRLDHWLHPPRVYEVSRTGVSNLSQQDDECATPRQCIGPHAPLPPRRDTWRSWGLVLALAGALLLASLSFRSVRQSLGGVGRFFASASGGSTWQARLAVLAMGLALIGMLVVLTVLGAEAVATPPWEGGEPFAWFEGVSAWPTQLIRTVAVLMGLVLLVSAFQKIRESDLELGKMFMIGESTVRVSLWQILFARLLDSAQAKSAGKVDVDGLWRQYTIVGNWPSGLLRALLLSIAFLVVAVLLTKLFGAPNNPVRGLAMNRFNLAMLLASVWLFLALLFYVHDATRLTDRFIEQLTAGQRLTGWAQPLVQAEAVRLGLQDIRDEALGQRLLDPWLDMRMIVQRTGVIAPLIYAPFVLLALLIAARWPAFDRWDTPVGLIAVFALAFAIACLSAFLLQRTAERARDAAIDQFKDILIERRGAAGGQPTPQQVEAMIERVRSLREGAFLPFLEQPAVRAALLPFGSAGGLYLLQLFALAA